ncbi:Uma2 family endonuclease [Haliscomenobacter sp.]|uniref:Uma2 family endonuclease n=1 Tax=Haliscomenobacter sp. TaxID=2717303 RepID=UPI002D1FAEF8|nr:Uma2 family endonuclease [Haliscomenobacter sp.]
MVSAQDLRSSILERLKTEPVARIPASEEEYFAIAEQLPFKVEYHNSEIITMGLASYFHEIIVANWIFILRSILPDEFTVLGSNSGIQIPKFEGGYYLPDVMVVKGEPAFKPNSSAIITNPYLIVEIHSPSTAQFDSDIKLPEYKQQESLQQIIYVNQDRAQVSSYRRTDQPNTWINQEFFNLEEVMQVEGQEVLIKDIYRKIKFE